MSGEQTAGGRGGGQETSDGDQRWGPNQVVARKTISNFGVHSAVVQTGVTSGSGGGEERGSRGPSQGMGLFLAVMQQLRSCAVERGQASRVRRVSGPLATSQHPPSDGRQAPPPLSRGLFPPTSNVWINLSALTRMLELTKGSEALGSGCCHRVRPGYLATSLSLRSGDGGLVGKAVG